MNKIMKKIFIITLLSGIYTFSFAQTNPTAPKVLVKPPSSVPTYEPYNPTSTAPAATVVKPTAKPVVKVQKPIEAELSDSTRTVVDTPPKSKKALDQMYQEIISDMDYPTLLRRNKTKGFVSLVFVVTKEGKTTDVQIEQKSSAEELNQAATTALNNFLQKNTNNWIPAVFKGKSVSAYYKINFNFTPEKKK